MAGLVVHAITLITFHKAKIIKTLFNQLVLVLTLCNIVHTIMLLWDSLGYIILDLVMYKFVHHTAKIWGVGVDVHR